MTRRAYVYFVVTFILGVVVGASVVFFYAWNTGRWFRPFNRQVFIYRLKRDLRLSASQVGQLEQIMDDAGRKFAGVRQDNEARLDELRKETRDRIRQLLSPEQVQKFDDLSRRVDERRRRHPH